MRPCLLPLLSRRAFAAALAALALAPSIEADAADGGHPLIVTTTAQIADIVRMVGGSQLDVVSLMGEGIDPHSYKLSRSDVAALARAAMVFHNGLMLEGKMTQALDSLARSGRPVYAVADAIPDDRLIKTHEQADPHLWHDVGLWRMVLAFVRDRLTTQWPSGQIAFANAFANADATLARLDAYARSLMAAVPSERRILVTAHDAFGYFGRAYGVEVIGIQGISTESEAGLQRIESLATLLATRRIPVAFIESSVSDRTMQALIQGAKAQGHSVRLGGSLYSDAMGPPGTYEGSYIGMIDHNLTLIAAGLGVTVPQGGFRGMSPLPP
jgi:manganese/zinc/iron transport system substrate-binding protein